MRVQEFLKKSTFFSLYFAHRQIYAKLESSLFANDFNLHQAFVLVALFFEEQASSGRDVGPKALADFLGVSKGRMSHVLCDLEERGLLRSQTVVDDKRRSLITLTNKGREKSRPLIKIFTEFEDQLDETFDDQADSLRWQLKMLIDRFTCRDGS